MIRVEENDGHVANSNLLRYNNLVDWKIEIDWQFNGNGQMDLTAKKSSNPIRHGSVWHISLHANHQDVGKNTPYIDSRLPPNHQHEQYGYGLWIRESPPHKTAENKVQYLQVPESFGDRYSPILP